LIIAQDGVRLDLSEDEVWVFGGDVLIEACQHIDCEIAVNATV